MAPVSSTPGSASDTQRKDWIKAPFALHPAAEELKRDAKLSTPTSKNASLNSAASSLPALTKMDLPEPTCKDVKQCVRPQQALCNQCTKRHALNQPVYFQDERNRKEAEQANLLQQFQHLKDLEAMDNEKKNKQKQREESKKVAAFNRGVADAIWEEKHKRNTQPDGTYIFKNRPVTPGKHGKQMAYNKALEGQLKGKYEKLEREKHDTQFYERLQLAQLQDSLNEEKDKNLKSKLKNMKNYGVALEAQIQARQPHLPKAEPDSVGPIFGVHHEDPLKAQEEKERYRDYFKSQLKEADERKKKALQDKLTAKQEGADLLARAHAEWKKDSANNGRRMKETDENLKRAWRAQALEKQSRLAQEKERIALGDDSVLEQILKFRRCCLCERDVKNTGQSHIIPNTKFVE